MTDTFSPITEPHPAPMFATGAQPVLSPNTEPNPAPIFDTGPHPDPLASADATGAPQVTDEDAADLELVEWDSDEWRYADWRHPDTEPAPESSPEPAADPDQPSGPELTSEPDSAGMSADLHLALDAIDPEQPAPAPKAFSELENVDTDAFLLTVTGHMPPVAVPAQPVAVPSAYQFVKRWKFALIVAGVWLLAAAAGLGFYYWWYTALDKTLPVFGILLYLVVCMVASVLVSMVPNRPQITAVAVALMAAPLASMVAAAVLHGAYYFEWIARPVIG